MYQNAFYAYPNMGYVPYGASAFGSAAAGASAASRGGLLARLFGGARGFNFSNFLGTTQRTLGVINQAIPVFYQIKPIWNNAKTMFRVMGALRDDDPVESTTKIVREAVSEGSPSTTPVTPVTIDNQPQFFL